MHDREASDWLRPALVRARLLDELGRLPLDEHLSALAALERQDVEIVLSDSATVTVLLADRWTFSVPVRDVVIDADEAAADADS